MDDVRVGSVIRSVRLRRGLRQIDVARVAGVSPALILIVERGGLEKLLLRAIRRVATARGSIALYSAVAWGRPGDPPGRAARGSRSRSDEPPRRRWLGGDRRSHLRRRSRDRLDRCPRLAGRLPSAAARGGQIGARGPPGSAGGVRQEAPACRADRPGARNAASARRRGDRAPRGDSGSELGSPKRRGSEFSVPGQGAGDPALA